MRVVAQRFWLLACLVLFGWQGAANVTAAVAHRQATVTICVAGGQAATGQQMRAALATVRYRLRYGVRVVPHAELSGRNCIRMQVPVGKNQRTAIRMVGAIGSVVIADGGARPLQTGTRVRLVCRFAHCAPHLKVGRTNLSARPPVLQIVVANTGIQRRSAGTVFDQSGFPDVTYSLTSAGSLAWCRFTQTHVNRFAAMVLDGRILSDPTIQQAICGGQTQITGLQNVLQARMLAAYLSFGPLPFTLDLVGTSG